MNGQTWHARGMLDRLKAMFNLQSEPTDLLKPEVDVRTQELLKHHERFIDMLTSRTMP
jgi:hypothetical protein